LLNSPKITSLFALFKTVEKTDKISNIKELEKTNFLLHRKCSKIIIKPIIWESFEILCTERDYISTLKEKIFQTKNFHIQSQNLYFGGVSLQNYRQLMDLDL